MAKGHLHVTVEEELLQHLDRAVGPNGPYRTRSAAVEGALRLWLARQLNDEIEAYYRQQPEDDAALEQEWSEAAATALLQGIDDDEERSRRKGRR